MSRYIDADAFECQLKEIEAITAMVHKNLGEDEEVGEISMPMFTIRNIMRKCAPIDIIRCRECKYWSGCKSTMHNSHLCGRAEKQNVDYWTDADDFCSYGCREEREGE